MATLNKKQNQYKVSALLSVAWQGVQKQNPGFSKTSTQEDSMVSALTQMQGLFSEGEAA